jgi:iron complex transport system ATP-binding protein
VPEGWTEPALVVDRVTAGYGPEPAVRDVSLTARAGEVVGLVGPNGSGKTTLIRVASRALRPRSGRVLVGGVDPYRVPARQAARLAAVVPQEVSPVFAFSVLEMVLLGRAPYLGRWGTGGAGDWARAREAMEAANVQHLADRFFHELSGGERQRVILAQALAQDAPVLLLDEPTTHLDLRHVLDLLAIVRSLAVSEGRGVLAIFHDLNLASAVSDRMYVLLGGRIAAEGSPDEVLTGDLLRSVYGVEAEVHPHPVTGRPTVTLGALAAPRAPAGRARAHVIGGAGRGAPVMRALASSGYEVSAGVLHGSDSDALLAERLNLIRVTVPPFSEIDQDSALECARMIAGADLLVVCDAPYGPGNVANLRIALDAARSGTRVVLLEQVPVEERDFTGGEATGLWSELRLLSSVVRTYEGVLAEVGTLPG